MSRTPVAIKEAIIDARRGGETVASLARRHKVTTAAIRWHLRNTGLIGIQLGVEIEKEVAVKLRALGKDVVEQYTNAPFDLLADGVRIDVKAATVFTQKKAAAPQYQFKLAHNNKTPKVISEEIDYFYLVFLSELYRPVYSLSAQQDFPVNNITIHSPETSPYKIEFLFNLDNGRENNMEKDSSTNVDWWICTERLPKGGRKILGPFSTRRLALTVRTLLEYKNKPNTYWVDTEERR